MSAATSDGERDDTFTARVLAGRPRFRIATDFAGNPALLVEAIDSAEAPEIALRHLSFVPGAPCRVRDAGGGVTSEVLAVLRCATDDVQLAELFRALEAPAQTSLQGLWCELFLIAQASRIRQAAMAWHVDPRALHDFTAGRQRIEVKSSAGPHRIHQFRLDQLLVPAGTRVVVASLLLDAVGRGRSIAELWDGVVAQREITNDLRDRLAHILTLALGRDWREARRIAFDPEAAVENLLLYDAVDIPAVSLDLPAGVSEVRFKAELTDVRCLSRGAVCREGGLFEAVFGR